MKGYKGMDKNMQCRGMQYQIGESYHVAGNISVCYNGLHFCERLKDVFDYYPKDDNRFFEVEASGTINSEGSKSAASDITINRIVYGDGNGDGDGYGYGNGDGNGDGDGYGYGNGDGDGYGYGNGYGDGYGNGIQRILLYV